jgi:hypothetical protein
VHSPVASAQGAPSNTTSRAHTTGIPPADENTMRAPSKDAEFYQHTQRVATFTRQKAAHVSMPAFAAGRPSLFHHILRLPSPRQLLPFTHSLPPLLGRDLCLSRRHHLHQRVRRPTARHKPISTHCPRTVNAATSSATQAAKNARIEFLKVGHARRTGLWPAHAAHREAARGTRWPHLFDDSVSASSAASSGLLPEQVPEMLDLFELEELPIRIWASGQCEGLEPRSGRLRCEVF